MGLKKSMDAIKSSDSPVLASIWEGTKGLGRNTVSSYTAPYHGKVGLSFVGGGIGAAAGGMLGAMSPNGLTPQEGAGLGMAAGALAPTMLGAVGALGIKTIQHSDSIFRGIGHVGSGIGSVGRGIGKGISAMGGKEIGKEMLRQNPIARYGNLASRAFGGAFKYTPEKTYYDEAKKKVVTKRGKLGLSKKGMVAGSIIGLGVMGKGLMDDIYNSRSGAPTGVTRATPSYLDNAGASGDLVFAMHQNRRG